MHVMQTMKRAYKLFFLSIKLLIIIAFLLFNFINSSFIHIQILRLIFVVRN